MVAKDPSSEVDFDLDAIANEFEELGEEGPPTRGDDAVTMRGRRRALPADLRELKSGIEAAHIRRLSGSTTEGYIFDERYEVYRFMIGGMGMVLEACNRQLQRKEALKLWLAEDANEQLLREAQTLARLRHPNIVTVYGVDDWNGRLYFKMEWIDGQDGRQWLRERPRSWREVVEIFIAAGTGLAAAHAADEPVQHGDFKPANVLVGDDGRVCVADFGVAGTLRSSERTQMADRIGGTTCFMAPERIMGRNGDARSDQYSFCVALWEALYGTMPFWGLTIFDLLFAIEDEELAAGASRVYVPEWMGEVLRKGVRFDPEQRYADMDELLAVLGRGLAEDAEAIADGEPEIVEVVSAEVLDLDPARAWAQTLSRYPFVLAAALSAVVLVLGALMTTQQSSPPPSRFRIKDTETMQIISAEHAQWRLSLRRFNEAKDALDRGDLEATFETWDDGWDRVRAQKLAPVYAAASLSLAKRTADTTHDLNTMIAGMVAAGAAVLFQEGEYWWFAKQARTMAADFFENAGEHKAAAFEDRCAAAHDIKQACD